MIKMTDFHLSDIDFMLFGIFWLVLFIAIAITGLLGINRLNRLLKSIF